MRPFCIAAALGSTLLTSVTARIQVHSYLYTEPLLDDIYQVHMSVTDEDGNNPRIVCQGGGSEFFSSDKTEVCLDYDNGGCNDPEWGVCSSSNTDQVTVYKFGYPEYVDPVNKDHNNVDCAPCGETVCAKCAIFESCHSDTSECPICDGKANYVCLEGDRTGWPTR
ncbi:hypothetical protein Q7P37_008743 [Cladosporium fusiforme]